MPIMRLSPPRHATLWHPFRMSRLDMYEGKEKKKYGTEFVIQQPSQLHGQNQPSSTTYTTYNGKYENIILLNPIW